jgi:hypothetical protein
LDTFPPHRDEITLRVRLMSDRVGRPDGWSPSGLINGERRMRRIAVLVLSIFIVGGAAIAATLTPAAAHRTAATRITVVRPVNGSGHAQPGFSIRSGGRYPIDCRYPTPSPGAVSPNIEFCFPTAYYAVACWRAAAAHKALCMQDPRTHKLVRFRYQGRFAPTGLAAPKQRAPLGIVLGDGDYCAIRDGGAWTPLPGHPRLSGYYVCRRDGAVWAQQVTAHNGVNESQPMWTVRTAQLTSRQLVTRRVVRAYFVGTATG